MNNTIFDDVFRTMIEKMPYLAVPLIKEVFHTSYPEDVKITQLRNEHQQEDGEIITDSCLLIGKKMYHIECQSTDDTTMVIRMIEYDFAIGIEHAEKQGRRYRIEFPKSCVYQQHLRASNALDFDDIIYLTVELFRRFPEELAKYQYRFPYVLVDEYQDTNHAQYQLISLLTHASGNLCVVGDDDQSIYRFRGATIENILGFEEEFPQCTVIRLEQNYRSTQNILDAANSVIANNDGRKFKHLWTDAGAGEKITWWVSRGLRRGRKT